MEHPLSSSAAPSSRLSSNETSQWLVESGQSLHQFSVLTLFPEALTPYLNTSVVGRARKDGLVKIDLVQIRDFTEDKHRTVDAPPFGGGEGMVLRGDVLHRAWQTTKRKNTGTIYVTPQGKPWNQALAKEISAKYAHVILVCGHYEGVDERFVEACVDEEISIGDYVLTGGELPALVILDTLIRLIPGAVGNANSVRQDSFEGGLLKYPQYTKPRVYLEQSVPEVLLTGNHAKIAEFRAEQQWERTRQRRPDLWRAYEERHSTELAKTTVFVKNIQVAERFVTEVLEMPISSRASGHFTISTSGTSALTFIEAQRTKPVLLSFRSSKTLESLLAHLKRHQVLVSKIQTTREGRYLQFEDPDKNVFEFVESI